MAARLVALNGAADIFLSGLLRVVGRHPGCDTRLDSSRVSRRHCCLAIGVGEVIVRDLGSSNGTWINDRRIDDGVLRHGDILGIAHLRFRLELFGPAGAGTPADASREPVPEPGPTAGAAAADTALHDPEPTVGGDPDSGAPGGGSRHRGGPT
jgi:pSer/pThr/pTyr-binding forkhead associated (FHA) protein